MGCVSSRSCRIRAPAMYSGQPCISCSKREDMKIESVHGGEATFFRYGLALIFLWIGAMKFTAYEAAGIRPLAENSPVMRWLRLALGVQAFSSLLGVIEIAAGVLLALRPISAIATVIGSGVAVATLLTTLTFLFTTPGWEASLGGFPALSALPGQFLLKDVVLLGAALSSLREALSALPKQQPETRAQAT